MKNFVQPGGVLVIEHTTGSQINSGDVVAFGSVIGVAATDIPDGESGSVQIEGVFELGKAGGTAWSQGDKLVWDADAGVFDKPANVTLANGDVSDAAFAAADAPSGNTTGLVALSGLGERV